MSVKWSGYFALQLEEGNATLVILEVKFRWVAGIGS